MTKNLHDNNCSCYQCQVELTRDTDVINYEALGYSEIER